MNLRSYKLLISFSALVSAFSFAGPAVPQTVPPCCGSTTRPSESSNLTIEMRRSTGQAVTFRLLQNGDAALYSPETIAGRIRGQRFLSVADGGRWITAPPEVWQEATAGMKSLPGLKAFMRSMAATPMTRTGETRTIAGITGDVYRVPSILGGTTYAVYTRDAGLRAAADAFYDIFAYETPSGPLDHLAAAMRNAGFPLQIEGLSTYRVRRDEDRSQMLQFPSSFSTAKEIRRLARRR